MKTRLKNKSNDLDLYLILGTGREEEEFDPSAMVFQKIVSSRKAHSSFMESRVKGKVGIRLVNLVGASVLWKRGLQQPRVSSSHNLWASKGEEKKDTAVCSCWLPWGWLTTESCQFLSFSRGLWPHHLLQWKKIFRHYILDFLKVKIMLRLHTYIRLVPCNMLTCIHTA